MKLPGEDDILRKLNQNSLDLYEYTDIVKVHINRIEGDFNKGYYQGFIVVSDGINNIRIDMKNIEVKNRKLKKSFEKIHKRIKKYGRRNCIKMC